MTDRKYLPTLSELVDRLSIAQLKEVFISEHREEYAQEISDIVHDIQLHLNESAQEVTAEVIRAIVVLSQMNLHIGTMSQIIGREYEMEIILSLRTD